MFQFIFKVKSQKKSHSTLTGRIENKESHKEVKWKSEIKQSNKREQIIFITANTRTNLYENLIFNNLYFSNRI